MSAQNVCSGNSILIFPCSGASDVGELSDRIARRMTKSGMGKMYCLAGIGGHVPDIISNTREAKRVIVIDGCSILCARKTVEHAGLKGTFISLEELGFKKGESPATGEIISTALSAVQTQLNEIDSSTT